MLSICGFSKLESQKPLACQCPHGLVVKANVYWRTLHHLIFADITTSSLSPGSPTLSKVKEELSQCFAPADWTTTRIALWTGKWAQQHDKKFLIPTQEQLPLGHKSLNRLGIGVGCCKVTMNEWVYRNGDDIDCDCGTSVQSILQLLICPLLDEQCCLEDLATVNEKAL